MTSAFEFPWYNFEKDWYEWGEVVIPSELLKPGESIEQFIRTKLGREAQGLPEKA